jgi:signal transduction histidine kinase
MEKGENKKREDREEISELNRIFEELLSNAKDFAKDRSIVLRIDRGVDR